MSKVSDFEQVLQNMRANEFENFVASVWSSMGWSTEVTREGRDKGVDIIATKSGAYKQKAIIQAKCYSGNNKVTRPDIQQYSTLGKQVSGTDMVIVVTSGLFTSEALDLADQINVKTVGGEKLAQIGLDQLPDEQLKSFQHQDISINRQADNAEYNTNSDSVPVDDLNDSEQYLADMYRGYYNRNMQENGKTGRRIIFQFDDDEEYDRQDYLLDNRTHYITLWPEPTELLERLLVTADKYQWDVLTYGSEWNSMADLNYGTRGDLSYFSLVFDTHTQGTDEVPDPERQAKITSLLFDSIFDQSLSGTGLKEAIGIYTDTASVHTIE